MPRLELEVISSAEFISEQREELTKITEAMMYNPNVANSESTIFLKIELVNASLMFILPPFSAAIASMPLNASKNAATVMYTVISANPIIASVNASLEPCGLLPSERMKHMTRRPR